MTLIPIVITGGASALATTAAPRMFSTFVPGMEGNTLFRYGSQLMMAFGGGWAVGQFAGRTHGTVWTLVGVAVIGAELVNRFILGPAGLAAYPLGDEYGYGAVGYEGGPAGSDYFLPNREDEGVPIGMDAYTQEFAY